MAGASAQPIWGLAGSGSLVSCPNGLLGVAEAKKRVIGAF